MGGGRNDGRSRPPEAGAPCGREIALLPHFVLNVNELLIYCVGDVRQRIDSVAPDPAARGPRPAPAATSPPDRSKGLSVVPAPERVSEGAAAGGERLAKDQTYHARVAALSMAHGAALVKLLRAHGRDVHAANVEAALHDLDAIVAREVGRLALGEAMSWVANHSWGPPKPRRRPAGR